MIRFQRFSFTDQELNNQFQAIQDALDEVQLTPSFGDVSVHTILGDTSEDDPYNFEDSFQVVAPDLVLGADAGTDGPGDTAFLATIMGNLLGDTLTKEGNYLAGVIGAFSITGTKSALFPSAGVIGIVMDGVTDVDGAVVAHIDGGDPSSETHAGAAFKVRQFNNHPSTSVEYGLDLFDDGSSTEDFQSGTPTPFTVTKAEFRASTGVCILTGAGAPTDGVTGDNFAEKGSLYIDFTNAVVYVNDGAITNPTWTALAFVP